MEPIEQDRHQFYYRPHGKIRHIRAWELLCQKAIECKYRTHLKDSSIEGLRHCIRAWLTMEDIDHCQDGDIILVDGRFAIEVTGTHRIAPRKATYRGDFVHVPIDSLWTFLTWFDKVYEIDF